MRVKKNQQLKALNQIRPRRESALLSASAKKFIPRPTDFNPNPHILCITIKLRILSQARMT